MIVGIDPGFSGALGWYDECRRALLGVAPMPLKPASDLFESEKGRRVEIDPVALTKALRALNPNLVVLERVNASPNMGVTSAFRFGEGFGLLVGVCAALGLRTVLAHPSAWKLGLGLSSDKAKSTELAARLFPEYSAKFLASKKSADLAEAALLAYYGTKFL